MQLYALQINGVLVSTLQAKSKTNYRCLECHGVVRLRAGSHRQKHFFHYQPSPNCGLSAKSMMHIQAQLHIQKLLTIEDCQLEQRFPVINRIADCFWISKRVVFEIQVSPISWNEVESRVKDYRSIGCEIVWVLHDRFFNQMRLGRAEMWLRRGVPTYYTNMDKEGRGCIYDQWEILSPGFRRKKSKMYPINITEPIVHLPEKAILPPLLYFRQERWSLYFCSDILDRVLSDKNLKDEIVEAGNLYFGMENKHKSNFLVKLFIYVKNFYWILFRMILERGCR